MAQYLKTTLFGTVLALLCCENIVQAQTDTLVQLKGALQMAEQRYPLLKSRQYEASAAQKNVDVTRYNNNTPSIDVTYQAGIATANNTTGMFYPNGILPISGPPSPGNNYSPAVGSAAGLLLNWEAVSFGQKGAKLEVSVSEANAKKAAYNRALFQHKINVISRYLDLLLEYDYLKIYRGNVQRADVNLEQSRVLTNSGMKPGVDTALFSSEFSKAKIDLMNAQKQLQVYQLLLAQLIVTNALPVPTDTTFLKKLPAGTPAADTAFSRNPEIQFEQSKYQLSKSKEQLLKKSYLPKLGVWGTTFARGSGFQTNGTINTFDGFALNRFNYGAGLHLSFPIMKYGETKRQLRQQNDLSAAALEKIDDSKLALQTQQQIANTTLTNNLSIAKETEQQLKSAQYAFSAMEIRYKTGLVNFADLMQSQYNLLKAELDNKKAYWDAWNAVLLQAAVQGDVTIFTNAIQ